MKTHQVLPHAPTAISQRDTNGSLKRLIDAVRFNHVASPRPAPWRFDDLGVDVGFFYISR